MTATRAPADGIRPSAGPRKVKKPFQAFAPLAESTVKTVPVKRRGMADQTCLELTIRAQIEEGIYDPRVEEGGSEILVKVRGTRKFDRLSMRDAQKAREEALLFEMTTGLGAEPCGVRP